jgi:hypothetical protein
MCAGRATALQKKYADEAKERMKVRKGNQPGASVEPVPHLSTDTGRARDKVGAMFGVSGRVVSDAVKVLSECE